MMQVECLRRQSIHRQFSKEIIVYYIKGFSKDHKKEHHKMYHLYWKATGQQDLLKRYDMSDFLWTLTG